MCGIIGFAGARSAADVLLHGLERLEYRGYDSAGIAVMEVSGRSATRRLQVRRAVGPVSGLARLVAAQPVEGQIGIGHTRWATHGGPSILNAHPHVDCSGEIAIVHNGTLENYLEITQSLLSRGHILRSATDSELIAHLIEENYQANGEAKSREFFVSAVRKALAQVSGGVALVAISTAHTETLVAARRGRAGSLWVAGGTDFVTVASDSVALASMSAVANVIERDHIAILAPGLREFRRIKDNSVVDPTDVRIPIPDRTSRVDSGRSSLFLTEIHEQPKSIATCTARFLSSISVSNTTTAPIRASITDTARFTPASLAAFRNVCLIACGTPFHGCLAGRMFIEDIAGIPAAAEYSHEFIYRKRPLIGTQTLAIVVSQSGETADSVLSLERAKALGATTVAITNIEGSTAARLAHGCWFMHCGPEYSVAQTKAFTTGLCVLLMLATTLGSATHIVSAEQARAIADELQALPERIQRMLTDDQHRYQQLALDYINERSFLFLGRGYQYPIAVEGALKLKELSYVHAEGYPAGEMKHGPIALIEQGYPVIAIIVNDHTRPKMLTQLAQLKARGARIIAVAEEGDADVDVLATDTLWIPAGTAFTTPMLTAVPLQLLACVFAEARGRNVDRPRNLAKSVTVE